jgi:hypothetical protein
MMMGKNLARFRAVAVAFVLSVTGAAVASGPVTAHSNTCSTGNVNYVVIVFVNSGQTGTNDDICYISTHSSDEEFSVNESGVADIGENANFHDAVSSMSVKNFGSDGLCVRYYQDAFRSVLKETQWIGAGEGDVHFTAAVNDNYDSLDLLRINESTCFS